MCFRRFEDGADSPISGKDNGLHRAKKSFCGHTYTRDDKVKQKFRKLSRRVSGSKGIGTAAKKPFLGENESLENNGRPKISLLASKTQNLTKRI